MDRPILARPNRRSSLPRSSCSSWLRVHIGNIGRSATAGQPMERFSAHPPPPGSSPPQSGSFLRSSG
jgi:hypothetical protein